MIAKLIIFVLKSSLFILNLSIFAIVSLTGCSSAKKEKSSPSNPSNPPSNTSNSSAFESSRQPQKPLRQQRFCAISPIVTPDKDPPSKDGRTPVSQTPTRTQSQNKTPQKQKSPEPLLPLEQTQQGPSKEPSRKPTRSVEPCRGQKTLKDVQEVDARGSVLAEKSANQDEFDDYLNKLGEK